MRALKKRLEKIEKVQEPKQAEPIVIDRVLVARDGTFGGAYSERDSSQ